MTITPSFYFWMTAAYLIGAVPFGLLVAQARGVDLRKAGSGNIGATNVFRTVGKGWGLFTFTLDCLKGFLPAFYFPGLVTDSPAPALGLAFGTLAIVGHNWPVFLTFKGGKGVATSAGVILGVAPLSFLCGLILFILVVYITGYVSVASMSAAVLIAFTGWFFYGAEGALLPGVLTLLAVMVVVRHRTNIVRLKEGTEAQVGKNFLTTEGTETRRRNRKGDGNGIF